MIRRLLTWLRRRACTHECSTRAIRRQPDGTVACPCRRCGLVLRAEYGLALPARLVR